MADRPGVLAEIAGDFGHNGVSIERVWQEGFGRRGHAGLHHAPGAGGRVAEDPAGTARVHRRAAGGERAARRGGGAVSPDGPMRGAHQWRGLIEEYRDRLPVSEATPVVTPARGRHAVGAVGSLSDETGCEVWLKYDGANPTGSFKDRGMTLAISKALEEGAKAVVCASTGNTSASRGRLRREGGPDVRRAGAQGQGRGRQDGPDPGARRPGAGGRRQLRRFARARQGPRRALPGHPRELGEPVPPAGPEDRARSRSSTRWGARPICTASRSATRATSPATGSATRSTSPTA